MKKRWIMFAVLFLLIGTIVPVTARAEQSVEISKTAYTAEDFVIEGDTVYGFSGAGIEKLKKHPYVNLPSVDGKTGTALKKVGSFAFHHNKHVAINEYTGGDADATDVNGNVIKDLGETFSESDIKGVTIPEGYEYIGQDAFDFNVLLSEVNLPSGLKHISEYAFAHCRISNIVLPKELEIINDNAFFDAGIRGRLELPAKLKELGERAFKGNRINELVFADDAVLTSLKEAVFEDNDLEEVSIPDSITTIARDAFNSNTGHKNYAFFVVLWTKNKMNPNHLEDKGNFFINPSEDKKNSSIDLNYNKWEESDFVFEGNKIKGFSPIGELKVKKNKELVLPSYNRDGEPIVEIMEDAFRNVDFEGESLKKYDIEKVKIPHTVEVIGDYAFQSNQITELEANISLRHIGQGAFMNNKIEDLKLNNNLVTIDNAAFHINNIYIIEIPENVEMIGFSAFRQCSAMAVQFKGTKVKKLGEMAFLTNAITEVTLPEGLENIEAQCFADNKLTKVTLPNSLKQIKEQAFAKNDLTEVQLPENVEYLSFNAFEAGRGADKVTVRTVDGKNTHNLADGNGHKLDPENVVGDKEALKSFIQKIRDLDKTKLRESTVKQYEDMIKEGESLLIDNNLTKSKMLQFITEGEWFLGRIELDQAIRYAEDTLKMPKTKNEADKKNLKAKLDYAVIAYNNYAVKEKKMRRVAKELLNLSDLCNLTGEISKCDMVQGVYHLKSPLPIPSYYIGVNMYYKPDGTIFYLLDMSYTIGEGTLNEYGAEIENVDEDNQGYHELAIPTLENYEGVNVSDILNHTVYTLGRTKVEGQEKYHIEGIYEAVKDAAKDAKKKIDEKRKLDTHPGYYFPEVIQNEAKEEKKEEEKKQEEKKPEEKKQEEKKQEEKKPEEKKQEEKKEEKKQEEKKQEEKKEKKSEVLTIQGKLVNKGKRAIVSFEGELKSFLEEGTGESGERKSITLNIGKTDKKTVEVNFNAESMGLIRNSGVKEMILATKQAEVVVTTNSLKNLEDKGYKDIKILFSKRREKLNQKKMSVFSIKLLNGKTGKKVSEKGSYKVRLSYQKKVGEKSKNIMVYEIGKVGSLKKVKMTSYNVETGKVEFRAKPSRKYVVKSSKK